MSEADSSPASGARPTAGAYVAVLAECSRLLGERTAAQLGALHNDLLREVQTALRETYDALRSDVFAELLRTLRQHGPVAAEAFPPHFQRVSRERLSRSVRASSASTRGAGSHGELSLLDDKVFSESLAVRTQAHVLAGPCEDELSQLLARVARMFDEDEVDEARNPLAPEAVAEALKHACWTLECSDPAREALFIHSARLLAPAMPQAYRALNEYLTERRVLPRLRPNVRRGGARPQRRPDVAAGGTADIVRRLVAPASAPQAASPFGGAQAGNASPVVLDALARLQRGEGEVELGGECFRVNPDAADTMNVLRALLDAGLARQVGALDRVVIDVVATLFDFIFDDERVPEAMKGLIGRLQLPVLRLALSDHDFFSNREHAARRLINTLAQAAATWDGEVTPRCALYRAAEPLVHRIQNAGGAELGVFVDALRRLEAFLTEQDRLADAKAAKLTTALSAREAQEIARNIAAGTVAPHVDDVTLPTLVRDLLRDWWSAVLADAALASEEGEDGDAWQDALATMDDLVWSVRPKSGGEERQRLVRMLPGLLARLRSGLDNRRMPETARDGFFAALVRHHAKAIKNDMQTPSSPTSVGPCATPAAKPEAAEHDGLDELHRGDWVELALEAGQRRAVRLSWVSPARTMFLFTNRQGARALALTRGELARRFERGEALLIDDEPLMDRLVADVLEAYRPQPTGAMP